MDETQPPTHPLALVTGAAHRLGKAFALCLARQGYGIVLHYNSSAPKAIATANEIRALGVPVLSVRADLSNETQVANLFSEIDRFSAARSASLKVLVNSAAIMSRGDVRSMSVADFDAVMSVNLRAPFLCAQQAYRRMAPGSLIVNISDVAAQKTWDAYPIYSVSKAALVSLTRIMARSFAPHVRVNAIAPGLVFASDNIDHDDWERLVNRLPIKRAAYPDEIVAALEYLLKNEYVTGQTIVVDGGYSML